MDSQTNFRPGTFTNSYDCRLSKYLPVQSNNRNTRGRCEVCSKLTIKTPMTPNSSSALIADFEHVFIY